MSEMRGGACIHRLGYPHRYVERKGRPRGWAPVHITPITIPHEPWTFESYAPASITLRRASDKRERGAVPMP